MNPYDAIFGFDWLQAQSPMDYDWKNKTILFFKKGTVIKLQGLLDPPIQMSSISATKVFNATKGNDVWVFVLLDHVPPTHPTTTNEMKSYPPELNNLLRSYQDIFKDPKVIPP